MVLEIEVPRPAAGVQAHFIKFAIRKSIDFPVVNCAAAIASENGVVRSARICLNSVYNLPYRVFAAEEYLAGNQSTLPAQKRRQTPNCRDFCRDKQQIQDTDCPHH
jgi:xanthine dehydrogenase YagS FAD-binding subunit